MELRIARTPKEADIGSVYSNLMKGSWKTLSKVGASER
jgi:hypothetical protein